MLQICINCTGPNTEALIDALDILNRGIHKAFVILLGPIHVSSSYHQKANLLKYFTFVLIYLQFIYIFLETVVNALVKNQMNLCLI